MWHETDHFVANESTQELLSGTRGQEDPTRTLPVLSNAHATQTIWIAEAKTKLLGVPTCVTYGGLSTCRVSGTNTVNTHITRAAARRCGCAACGRCRRGSRPAMVWWRGNSWRVRCFDKHTRTKR